MTYTLAFLPEVEDDIAAGYAWYEEKSRGLGEEFLRTFYSCAGQIKRNPLFYLKRDPGFRRCLLRRFPYAIYFTVEADQVLICGVFHSARDPRTIRSILEDRGPED